MIFNEKTLKQVHELVQESIIKRSDYSWATEQMNSTMYELRAFLANFEYLNSMGQNRPLNETILSKISVVKAAGLYGTRYNEIINKDVICFDDLTLKQFHEVCQKYDCTQAATHLMTKIDCVELRIMTYTIYVEGKPVPQNYKEFSGWTEEVVRQKFPKEYDKKLRQPRNTLNEHSLHDIHRVIRNKKNQFKYKASIVFGVLSQKFDRHIEAYKYKDAAGNPQQVDYNLLLTRDYDQIRQLLGAEIYHKVPNPVQIRSANASSFFQPAPAGKRSLNALQEETKPTETQNIENPNPEDDCPIKDSNQSKSKYVKLSEEEEKEEEEMRKEYTWQDFFNV